MSLMKKIPYGQSVDLGGGVSLLSSTPEHILGAGIRSEMERAAGSIAALHRRHIGRYNSPIIRDPQTIAAPADFVITESTYGGARARADERSGPALLDAVKFCIAHNSRISCRLLRWGGRRRFSGTSALHRAGQIPPIRI